MRRRKQHGSWLGPLIVIAAVGGVGYLLVKQPASTENPATTGKTTGKTATSGSATTTAPEPYLRFGSANPGGASDRLFTLTLSTKQIKEEKTTDGWRISELDDRMKGLTITTKSSSDASILTGSGWSVPLRDKQGKAYSNARLLGVFDDKHAAVAARADSPVILAVTKIGAVNEVATLDDTMNPLTAVAGAVWMSTFVPGEGIESAASGPSTLIKLTADGVASSVMTSPTVIVGVLPGPSDAMAVMFDDGSLQANAKGQSQTLQGKPLVWMDDHELVFSREASVHIWNADTKQTTDLGVLPEEPAMAMMVKK